MKIEDFKVGQWVRLHPASNWWMRGIRYATVEKVGRILVTLTWHRGEGTTKTFTIRPKDIQEIL